VAGCCRNEWPDAPEYAERKGKVLFINGELEYKEDKNQNKLRDSDIQHVLDVYDTYEDERRYSKVVDMDEIRENDYNLNIRKYADTSPPPEQFDVKAILRGGVPVSEIEDDYIQETLDGMDVSCVFVRRGTSSNDPDAMPGEIMVVFPLRRMHDSAFKFIQPQNVWRRTLKRLGRCAARLKRFSLTMPINRSSRIILPTPPI